MQKFWATTPSGKAAVSLLKAFQPNPNVFRPLTIGQACSQEAAKKNWGVDPGCLVNGKSIPFFLTNRWSMSELTLF
jgi:hypothetical protein